MLCASMIARPDISPRTLRIALLPPLRALLGTLVLAGALAGCGHARIVPAAVIASDPLPQGVDEFPGAPRILDGLDIAPDLGQWRTGDAVLVGLTFERAGQITRRLLLIELLDAPGRGRHYSRTVGVYDKDIAIDSPTRATRLSLFDEHAAHLSTSEGEFVELFLDHAPWHAANLGGGFTLATNEPRNPDEPPKEPKYDLATLMPSVYGMMSLVAFGEGAGDDKTLDRLVRQAFTTSQKLSLLLSLGRFQIYLGESAPGTPPGGLDPLGTYPLYRCDLVTRVAGKDAVAGSALLAPSRAPLGLCGGIVESHGTNATDPSIRVRSILLAARRGPAPAPLPGS